MLIPSALPADRYDWTDEWGLVSLEERAYVLISMQEWLTGAMLDPIIEGKRLVEEASAVSVPLRLAGGVAMRAHAPDGHPAFRRECGDLDLATTANAAQSVDDLLSAAGYTPNHLRNRIDGARRRIYYSSETALKVDVFVGDRNGDLKLWHTQPLTRRLDVDPLTIPLAEQVLMKLASPEHRDKDIFDVCGIVHEHPLGASDVETVNSDILAACLARDWGLWRTTTEGIERCLARVTTIEIADADRDRVRHRLEALQRRLDDEPKTLRWRARAAIGERVRWYRPLRPTRLKRLRFLVARSPYAVGHFVWRGVRQAIRLIRRRRFGACGTHARFDPFGSYLPPEKMFFGPGISIGPGARVWADEGFYVAEAATISPELCVMGRDPNMRAVGRPLSEVRSGGVNLPVRVGRGAWLGARVTLLKGVLVGEGSVVGAGSVVTKDVPAYTVAAGNPCRPVRARFSPEELAEHLRQTVSPLSPQSVIADWRDAGL